ncbi:MAG: N-acetyltransferase family protein [Vicinamibacterales bacterium]
MATTSDAAAVAAIYAPYCEGSAVSFEQVPPTPEQIAQRIATVTAHRPWIVLEDDGAVAGYAYALPHNERWAYRWSVNTAIYISSAHQRRGAGRALYATLFDLLGRLGYYKAVAGITLPNEASVGLHAAMGFELVGVYRDIGYKLGAWRDVAWYQASIQPLPPEPEEPRAIGALHGTNEWDDAVKRGRNLYVRHT